MNMLSSILLIRRAPNRLEDANALPVVVAVIVRKYNSLLTSQEYHTYYGGSNNRDKRVTGVFEKMLLLEAFFVTFSSKSMNASVNSANVSSLTIGDAALNVSFMEPLTVIVDTRKRHPE